MAHSGKDRDNKCVVCGCKVVSYQESIGSRRNPSFSLVVSDDGVLTNGHNWICNECWGQMGFIESNNIYKLSQNI